MNGKVVVDDKQNFAVIYNMIAEAKLEFWKQANKSIIELYFNIGKFISQRVNESKWGQKTIIQLAAYIKNKEPINKGFSDRSLWRMKQFYETYKDLPRLTASLLKVTWSNHLHIMSKTKTIEEKEFYLQLAANNHYTEKSLAKIIDSGTYERTMIANTNLSTIMTEFPAETKGLFKSSYIFDFIDLPFDYKEHDLRKALINNLRNFLLEMGPNFSLIGEEYVVQVGMKDFKIDLLLHNRNLNALVAVELKTTEFEPEYLGKLQFYLEALDQDVKKPHENPSIGILICKTKNKEIVKYAINRSMSPAMVAEYETKLIDKKLLAKKLHEISEELSTINNEDEENL